MEAPPTTVSAGKGYRCDQPIQTRSNQPPLLSSPAGALSIESKFKEKTPAEAHTLLPVERTNN